MIRYAISIQILDYSVRPFPNLKQIIFNVMLREWGVRGIQVNEVVPLDAIFDSSPTSTFGLIFLSRYTSNKGGNQAIKIPDGLWFANQVNLLP
jgi:ubiquitin carboxyl-terminal hydrolase L5